MLSNYWLKNKKNKLFLEYYSRNIPTSIVGKGAGASEHKSDLVYVALLVKLRNILLNITKIGGYNARISV